jgi:cytochrome c oxidase subunit IV
MSEEHDDPEHGVSLKMYIVVFSALCVFTLVSFLVNAFEPTIGAHTGMAIIMAVAVCKATLVCMFFMHLKFDWSKLYILIVPVSILGVMMMIILMPDIVVAWPQEPVKTQEATTKHKH